MGWRGVSSRPLAARAAPPSTVDDPIVDRLDTLIAEIRGLREVLAQARSPRPATLSRADRDRLARLLPAIAGAIGSDNEQTAAELLEIPAVRLVVDLDAAALGRLLRRATGIPIAGYVVTRGTTELQRVLWTVRATV
jgi:hypothetical protein